MLPKPDKATILEAVAEFLKQASKQDEPPPGFSFQLRLAASLVAMAGRESRLDEELKGAHASRFPDGEEELWQRVREQELSPDLLALLRADLVDQLKVVAPHFDTRLEVDR